MEIFFSKNINKVEKRNVMKMFFYTILCYISYAFSSEVEYNEYNSTKVDLSMLKAEIQNITNIPVLDLVNGIYYNVLVELDCTLKIEKISPYELVSKINKICDKAKNYIEELNNTPEKDQATRFIQILAQFFRDICLKHKNKLDKNTCKKVCELYKNYKIRSKENRDIYYLYIQTILYISEYQISHLHFYINKCTFESDSDSDHENEVLTRTYESSSVKSYDTKLSTTSLEIMRFNLQDLRDDFENLTMYIQNVLQDITENPHPEKNTTFIIINAVDEIQVEAVKDEFALNDTSSSSNEDEPKEILVKI